MKLNYIKEHTSCVNYKTEEDAGFALKEAASGEHFDNRQQKIKANHLIFILSGEVSITKDSKSPCGRIHLHSPFIPLHGHGYPAGHIHQSVILSRCNLIVRQAHA